MRLNNNVILIKANNKKNMSIFDYKGFYFLTEANKYYNQDCYITSKKNLDSIYKTYSYDKHKAFWNCLKIRNVLLNNKNINVKNYGIFLYNCHKFSYVINFEYKEKYFTCYITSGFTKIMSSKENIMFLLNNIRYVKTKNEYRIN